MTQTHINNRYLIQDKLGEGGMGAVYLASDRLTGEGIALKRIHLDQLEQIEGEQSDPRLMLAHEFQTLSSLRHPHIISVLDYGFDRDHQPFYTMTYLPERKNILVAGDGLNLNGKVNLIRQMLQALAYLHRRKIFHRDIKPDNVLVYEGRLRLLDFGLAAVRSNQPARSSGGTLVYWPPELWLGEPYTEATDMFAAGVIAYELLTGRHPFAPVDSFMLDRVLGEEPHWSDLNDETEMFRPFLAKLLAKLPEDRFQKIGEAVQTLDQIVDRSINEEAANIRESYLQAATFVGRTAELDQLKQALAVAKTGKDGVWLIGGESGVGKTRFLDEFRAHALVAGWQVIVGQAIDGGGSPYQLWRDIIPHLLLSIEVSDLEASILAQITPTIGRLFDENIPDPPDLDGSNMQKEIVETVLAILQRQPQPTLLILEDLQWAIESLNPIKALLASQSKMENLFVVGTYRDDERADLPSELDGAQSIRLNRLAGGDIHQLSQAILGDQESSSKIVSLLVQETEGNTFFIVEVLRSLAEQVGRLDKVGDMLLPESVSTKNITQILRRRIEQVPAEDYQLLQLAAIAGRQIDQQLLHSLSPSLDLDSWLQRVADVAIFTVRNDQWLFSHDKLRETMLSDLSKPSRQQMHREVALGLETIYTEEVIHKVTIMDHWRMAGDVAKELEYLPLVSTYLFKVLANFEQAIEAIKRGLQILSKDDERRLPLLNRLVDIYVKRGLFETADQLVQEELALAKKLDDPVGLAYVLINLGFLYINQRRYSETEKYLKQCFELLDPEKHIHILDNAYHGLGQVEMLRGNNEQALIYHHKSLELRQRVNDHKASAFSLNNIGEVYYYQGAYAKAKGYFDESLTIRYQHADPHSITYALISMAFVQLKLGDPQAKATVVKALNSAVEVKAEDLVLKAVLGFAYLYLDMKQKEFDIQVGEIIGLATNHPSFSSRWDLIMNDLNSILAIRLEPKEITQSLETGRSLALNEMIQTLLSQFST